MRLKRIAEAVMWLPGFAPEDDPIAVDGFAGQEWKGEIIAFPSKEARQSSVMTFWPGLNASDFDGLSGEVTKFEANCSAIVLLRKLEDEGRGSTTEERTILNRYTGWGGLPWAFNPDQDDSNRKIRVERLQTLLAEDEYESARASTTNAHYTSVEIIDAMWAAVRRLGFTGGRILEPSAGNGYFLGAMPREVAEKSTVTAVEIDQLSARLLTSLYGGHGVRVANEGFEVARLPADFFDLVISNVPFGNYQTPETRHVPFRDFLIHDYFFARALEVVRPGGLVAFITSAGTLDKSDTTARKYLANRARLLGSIRLPLQAFQKIANTEVTTDIVFLQKLKEGEAGNGDDWAEWPVEIPSSHIARDAGIPAWQWRNVRVCKWFAERPEWIVGKLTLAENGYGKANACTFEGDIGAALLERVALLPEGVYRAVEQARDRSEGCAEVRVLAGNFVKPGAYKLVDGKVAVSEGHELRVVEGRLSARAVERIRGMIEIRDAARKLVAAQASTDDDTLLAIYRVVLNAAYDAFSAKCGHIHAKANRLAFRGDPDLPLLLSLERWDEETQTAEKMDIFHRRTVGAARQIEHCETPEEALIASIQQTGRVSVARMEALLGQPGYEFIPQLQEVGAIFLNPDSGSWETADTYLAGNVRQKLMFAENAGRKFASNVEALKAVIPDDLAPHEIGARIGSVWIPATDYQAFLDEIMECEGNSVEFNATAGAWQIDPNHATRWSVAATQTYGTERVGAMTLFEQALNQQVPTVTDPAPDDRSKRIVNQKETIAAREKLQELREKFQEWLWLDDERTPRLVRLYNDQFNCIVQRRYDGKHLVLPGFSQVYRLHDHQRDAIWRVISCKSNTLLAHVVGAGKTLTMICAGMELRRLGVAGKPCYVVPNHMLEQFAAEFLRAYPGANILMASKDDLQGDKRRTLLSRIATGDWDGVLITHSSFERIKLGDEFIKDFIQKQIDEIEQAIRDANQNRGNRIVKELERAKKVWLARLTKLAAREKKDDVLTFDELGIDWLFVDEAHCFPGQTPVLTELGWLPIGDVVRRRLSTKVASVCIENGALEWRAVTDWISTRTMDPLVRVTHEGGVFECTADHQVWTYEDGYVEAARLRSDHHLRILRESGQTNASWETCPEVLRSQLRKQGHRSQEGCADRDDYKNLPAVREDVFVSVIGASERRKTSVLFGSMCGGLEKFTAGSPRAIQAVDSATLGVLEREAASWREGSDVEKQSNEISGDSGKGETVVEWPDLSRERGERKALQAANLVGRHLGSSDGICNTDDGGEGVVSIIAQSLQGGYSRPAEEGGHRGGREFPQSESVEVPGQAKSRNTERSRLVCVEVLESGSAQQPGSCRGEGQDVYCLEVDDNHNFFAAGVLVSNCFKNLYRFTKMTRVAGLPNSNSERAFDMFLKTRCVMARHQGHAGVAFATGTPVSNSMAEMWTMQRYLQPDTLSAFRLQQFDTWAGNFGESVTALELAPDGRGYRMHTRFARFVNLPELMSMFGQVADIRTAEMLKLPVPRALKEAATAKPTPELKAYVQTLVERSEAIRNGTVTPQQDNMLAVTGDGRKAALDMRLVDPFAEDYEGSKTNQCAEKVFGVWKETASTRGTQIIFCDLSTPVEDGRFSVYQDLRRKLIEMGVPVADIAFIHDYDSDSQKEELFKAVREGRVRVVLGSTQKMGVGTNVQTRLAALHHLDAPWRPSDVEQREGRIIRQGNLNEEVRIHRYVTEGSFDAYIWQTLETKARFIAQVMQGNTGMRSAEDVELAALSYAEVKALASGNPLVLEKAGVDTELAKLALLKSQWEQQQWRNKSELAALPGRIECIQQRIAGMEGDVANRQNVTGDSFRMQIDGTWYSDRTEVTRQLVLRFSVVKPGDTRVIGLFGGFRMAIRSHVKRDFGKRLVLLGNVEHEAGHTDNPNGFIRVLENLMNRMEERLAEDSDYLARTEKRMSDLKAEIAKQFDKADRLAWLACRQREIDAALDLSKGDTSAVEEEEPSETV